LYEEKFNEVTFNFALDEDAVPYLRANIHKLGVVNYDFWQSKQQQLLN